MPVTLKVECGSLPPPGQLLADLCQRVGFAGVACAALIKEPKMAQQWSQDFTYHFYLPILSTTGVELFLTTESCLITALPLASPPDMRLALELVREILQYGGGAISSSDGLSANSAAEFRSVFSDEWVANYMAGTVDRLYGALSEAPRTVLILSGPARPFYFGERLATAAINAVGDDPLHLADYIWQRMRRTQYVLEMPEREKYALSTVYSLRVPGQEGKEAAYFPSLQGVLVPKVDFLAMDGDKVGDLKLLPSGRFSQVLPQLLSPAEYEELDEVQYTLAPLKDSRYTSLVKELGQYCI